MKSFFNPLLITLVLALCAFASFSYQEYLKVYDRQQDRILFQETYKIVTDCRKQLAPNMSIADKACGEIPTFFNEVK